jgi:DNA-directed RNA polymerase subunit RPC12/RpoP
MRGGDHALDNEVQTVVKSWGKVGAFVSLPREWIGEQVVISRATKSNIKQALMKNDNFLRCPICGKKDEVLVFQIGKIEEFVYKCAKCEVGFKIQL